MAPRERTTKYDMKIQGKLEKIIPNYEIELGLLKNYINKLNLYEKEGKKWYIKSHDSIGKEKLVLNEINGKKSPEEIVRQLFLLELIEYYKYPINRIEIERTIIIDKNKKKNADIVVYQEDKATPLIIVEVFSPNQKLDLQSLKSYLKSKNSPIVVGISGKEKTFLFRPHQEYFDDTLPDIPFNNEKNIEEVFKRNWTWLKLEEINLKERFNLRLIIETLDELVLANSGVESFSEIFNLIYAKLYDEIEAKKLNKSILKFRKYEDPKITFDEISKLLEKAKNKWPNVFEGPERIKLTPEHLSVCIGQLEKIKLLGTDLRIIDEAFEYLVPEVSKSKKGQYFTPRVIIDAIIQMLNPSMNEYVIDPACGSAGFLVHSMKYVSGSNDSKTKYGKKYLWGIDFDERSTKISKAMMLIAGDGKSHIYKENSLEYNKWDDSLLTDLKSEGLLSEGPKELKFDILMTNPPFAGDIWEKQLISLYSIINQKKKSVSRHLLFIERALDMVKPGGRLAIILPQGIFNNTSDKYIREFIFKKARILAVVGLDNNSFKPHTGTKTSILFLRKWDKNELDDLGNPTEDYDIFFAVSKIPFKDNSGKYVFNDNKKGEYKTDLYNIADAFVNWGITKLEEKDNSFNYHFKFLRDGNANAAK